MNKIFNVIPRYFHDGKEIHGKKFFEDNPDIWAQFPNHLDFMNHLFDLREKTAPNKISYLDVSINGFIEHLNVRDF